MGIVNKIVDFLKRKGDYIFENPFYNRSDLLLKQIVNYMIKMRGISQSDKKTLRIIKNDMIFVGKTRKEKIDSIKSKVEDNELSFFDDLEKIVNLIDREIFEKEKLYKENTIIDQHTQNKEIERLRKEISELRADLNHKNERIEYFRNIIKFTELSAGSIIFIGNLAEFLSKHEISIELFTLSERNKIFRVFTEWIKRNGNLTKAQLTYIKDVKRIVQIANGG